MEVTMDQQSDIQQDSPEVALQDLIKDIENIICRKDVNQNSVQEMVKTVSKKLSALMTILLENSWQNIQNETCIRIFTEHDILSQVFNWIAGKKELMKSMTVELLLIYDNILSIASDSFIRGREFIEPLMLLLLALRPNEKKRMPHEMELKYIRLINNLCLRLIDDQFLKKFESVLISKQGYKLPRYGFLNLLMSFVHENSQVGNFARDSLIICMQVSASNSEFGKYIAYESDCCNILAAGLIGLYSALSTTLDISNDDWYCITRDMVIGNQDLMSFVKGVKFCCEVISFGHQSIGQRLLALIHDGFLSSVLAAALHQPVTEAVVAAVAYLDLFIREVTEESFMRTLLKFLLSDEYDGVLIIDTLTELIHSQPQQLCMVTLQLFKTLMNLNCEDIIYHLMIRFLIPCKHILPNQKRIIKELDFYCKSATMFLYLTPSCCVESHFSDDDSSEESAANTNQVSKDVRKELLRNEFIECLGDARVRVRDCKEACQCWSAVYDGMDVMTELPRRRASSALICQAKTDRSNSDVFSFAMRSSSIISESDKEKQLLSKTTSLPVGTSHPVDSSHSVDSAQGDSVFPAEGAEKMANGYVHVEKENNLSKIDHKYCLGPFMTALYELLENMLDNSFYMNLQLTSLLSRIACYPQPLLRSLLLNSNLVMQPGVKSLFQILTNVAQTTDIFVSQLDDFKQLMSKARQNLLKREKKCFGIKSEQQRKDSIVSTLSADSKDGGSSDEHSDQSTKGINTIHTTGGSKQTGADSSGRKDSLYAEAALAKSVTGARIGRLHPALRSPQKRITDQSMRADQAYLKKKNPTAIKNAIYCAIVLEEWLKELAAISLEHNLV